MNDTVLGALIGVAAVVVGQFVGVFVTMWTERRKSRATAVARITELLFDHELTTSEDFQNRMAINRWEGQVLAATIHCSGLFAHVVHNAMDAISKKMGSTEVEEKRRSRAAGMVTGAAVLELRGRLTKKRLLQVLRTPRTKNGV